MSRAAATTPSPARNPAARSKSWPGVRMVTVSGAPPNRISIGSSTTRVSARSPADPSRIRSTFSRVVTRPIRPPPPRCSARHGTGAPVCGSFHSPGSPAAAPPAVGPLAVPLHVLEAEAALDAQVAVGDRVVVRGGHLDDLVLLDVQRHVAPHPAVGAHGGRLRLLRLVPGALGAHVELGGEGERAGRADLYAVPAVHAGRVGQCDVVLGGDAGVETAPGHTDREGVLPLLAAGVHALVAHDALGVVAHVEEIGRAHV